MSYFDRFVNRLKSLKYGGKGTNTRVIKPMRIVGKNNIFLGDNVTILNDARMETHGEKGRLSIGNGTSIEQGCHLIAADNLEIGRDCVISAWVYISDCNHIYNTNKSIMKSGLAVKKTKIGNHVFVGIGARILPGVTVGDYAVIGANAVVTKDIPPFEVWGGVPAKYIGRNVIQQ